MVVIMSINLGLGFGVMRCKTDPPPPADYRPIPPMIDPPDAAVDADRVEDAGADADAGPAPADALDAGVAPSLPDDVER